MDGAPVFSLVRECLPLAGLRAVRGVFTSTTTVVLEAVEEGFHSGSTWGLLPPGSRSSAHTRC